MAAICSKTIGPRSIGICTGKAWISRGWVRILECEAGNIQAFGASCDHSQLWSLRRVAPLIEALSQLSVNSLPQIGGQVGKRILPISCQRFSLVMAIR